MEQAWRSKLVEQAIKKSDGDFLYTNITEAELTSSRDTSSREFTPFWEPSADRNMLAVLCHELNLEECGAVKLKDSDGNVIKDKDGNDTEMPIYEARLKARPLNRECIPCIYMPPRYKITCCYSSCVSIACMDFSFALQIGVLNICAGDSRLGLEKLVSGLEKVIIESKV